MPDPAFELIERIDPDALARHPAWTHFEAEVDRGRILGWGVSLDRLEHQEGPFAACGLMPLYPILRLDEVDDRGDHVLAASFTAAGGSITLTGYLLEPHAFGIFHDGHEFSFNRNLAGFSGREAKRLARALGCSVRELFPMRWSLDPRLAKLPGDASGEIPAFW